MAVAVMSPQHVQVFSPGRVAFFKGDDELLVDRLVAACQQRIDKPALPGFGRELVPYFGDDEATPLPAKSATTHIVAPPANIKKALAGKASAAKTGGVKRGVAERKNRSPGKQESPGRDGCRATPQPKRTKPITAARDNEPRRTRAQLIAPASASVEAVKAKRASGAAPAPTSFADAWAGPSFCHSPTPEAIPMPTTLFLGMASLPRSAV